MLTIGYIGNGKSANRYHIPYVLTRDNMKIKTIYDLRVSHDVWKEVEGVNYTENIDDLLNDSEIDLIVICTTPKNTLRISKRK